MKTISIKLIDGVIPHEVRLLAKWRKQVQPLWRENFKVTLKGTAKWVRGLVSNPEKMLFFIIKDDKMIGHIGYDEIGYSHVYIGNVVRGEGESDGSMTASVKILMKIAHSMDKDCYVRVLYFNKDAIRFYKKIGFKFSHGEDKYVILKYGKPKNIR